jgi:TaqI-like C-terminal specificity domain/Eco57I restriction-modification methylase
MMINNKMDYSFLSTKYDPAAWSGLLAHIFGDAYRATITQLSFSAENRHIDAFAQIGQIQWNESSALRTTINVYEIKLNSGTTKIHLNRVAVNTFLEQIRSDAAVSGALAVFVDEQNPKWRLSFVSKRSKFNIAGEEEKITTTPKRFTYLFGPGENIRTAESRFTFLARIEHKRLDDVIDAFSVEKVSDDFFKAYREIYATFCEDIYQSPDAQSVFGLDDNSRKNQRDFVKRTMGRITFLYFVQKKGWLGAPPSEMGFANGNPYFMRQLFESAPDKSQFYSCVLAPLFFVTLNKENRTNDQFQMPDGSQVKVPYLNGGLFERDFNGSENLNFQSEHFNTLFDTFEQYNFTIDESSPYDHEVGIDPEMLGIVFENLLEDNNDKGTFYTPKAVVHYMCQESLVHYLSTHLPVQDTEQQSINELVKHKISTSHFITENKDKIAQLLHDVKVCDPAIGSGAFPMGMLYEILYCLLELEPNASHYELKKRIIQNSIYGVDFEKGAVDIARLRFWLSLVVDAELMAGEKPEPLPNLDYKIMQGDSLLERFKDIPLDKIANDFVVKVFEPGHGDLSVLNEPEPTYGGLQYKTDRQQNNLKTKIEKFFKPMPFEKKAALQREIDTEIHEIIQFNFERQKEKPLHEITKDEEYYQGNKDHENDAPGKREQKAKNRTSLRRKIELNQKKIADLDQKLGELEVLMSKPDQKHYFLWHAYFQEVMETGGFDIMIANPPYIQLQKHGAKTDDYEAAGFQTFARMGDIYCLFYEQGFNLLRKGGILTYITSNKWMRADYGKPLRKLLAEEAQLLRLIDFGSVQVFKTATVDTNILIARKDQPAHHLKACRFTLDYTFGAPLDTHIATHEITMPTPDAETVWSVSDKETFDLTEAIKKAGKPLKDWKITQKDDKGHAVEIEAIKMNYGIKTGYNKAFIIPTTEKQAILNKVAAAGASVEQYEALFKPILEGKHIKRFRAEWEELWVIFTRRGISISEYPFVEEYLQQHYDDLRPKQNSSEPKGRKPGPYKWYEIQDPVAYYPDFDKPKLIWGNLNVNATFTVDFERMYINAPANMLTSERDDIKYLGAVLNSRVTSFMMRQIAYSREHGYLEYKKVFVEQMPVPEIPAEQQRPFAILVDYLLYLYDKSKPVVHPHISNEGMTAVFEKYLNMAVFELYFEQHMKENGYDVLQFFDLPDLTVLADDSVKAVVIREQYERLEAYGSPIRDRAILANLHSKHIVGKINSTTF